MKSMCEGDMVCHLSLSHPRWVQAVTFISNGVFQGHVRQTNMWVCVRSFRSLLFEDCWMILSSKLKPLTASLCKLFSVPREQNDVKWGK